MPPPVYLYLSFLTFLLNTALSATIPPTHLILPERPSHNFTTLSIPTGKWACYRSPDPSPRRPQYTDCSSALRKFPNVPKLPWHGTFGSCFMHVTSGEPTPASWRIRQEANELLEECEAEIPNWQFWFGAKTTVGGGDEVGIWFGFVGGYKDVNRMAEEGDVEVY